MFKAFTCGALISSIGLGCIIQTSAASIVHGGSIYTTYNGVSYDIKNIVLTGLESNGFVNRKYARAATDVSASENVFDDAFAARAVLCDVNGIVVAESEWHYSGSVSAGVSDVVSKTFSMSTTPPKHYSHGFAKVWTGSYYNTFQPLATSSINDYTW